LRQPALRPEQKITICVYPRHTRDAALAEIIQQGRKDMSVSSIRGRFPVVKAAAFAAAVALGGITQAQAAGPFSGIAGSWAGGGSIAIGNGANERIRCLADYRVGDAGAAATLQIRCASDSYKFELQGNVRYQNGQVLGDWSETTRGAAGRVAGTIRGNQIDVRVEGPTFAALLSLITRGDKQSISIKAPSGSQMSEANITLTRRG
jgi:hypothetical protein